MSTQKLTSRITIRITPDESTLLKRITQSLDLTIASFVRTSFLTHIAKTLTDNPKLSPSTSK